MLLTKTRILFALKNAELGKPFNCLNQRRIKQIGFMLKNSFSYSSNSKPFTQKYNKGEYYAVLGFDSSILPQNISDQEVKMRYYMLLKKYHTDYAQQLNLQQRNQYDEITKCLTRAYDKIMQQRNKTRGTSQRSRQEYQISIKIFGKKFNEIKYDLHRPQNRDKQKAFFQELGRNPNNQNDRDQFSKKQKAHQEYQSDSINKEITKLNIKEDSNNTLVLMISLSILGFIGVLRALLNKNAEGKQKNEGFSSVQQPPKILREKFKEIQSKTEEMLQKRVDDIMESFIKERPKNMLKYPGGKDPDIYIQLFDYSIAPDIHLYEIPPEYFFQNDLVFSQQELIKRRNDRKFEPKKQKTKKQKAYSIVKNNPEKQLDVKLYPINQLKPNILLSMSLEAERCLQNIYVRVSDVIKEIQETGKYEPPMVCFMFRGYMMFKIRQKPLSLANYRNTDQISLFELYFDYYSPIFFKRYKYYIYLVNEQNQFKFGNVTLNCRELPQVLIKGTGAKKTKIVFMQEQAKARNNYQYYGIWSNFYQKYGEHLTQKSAKGIKIDG